jgi:hypothetical protein
MTPDICPYCQQSLHVGIQQAGKRVCSLCGLSVRKRHKWHIGSDGRIRHRDCKNPTGNTDTKESKGLF